MGVTKTEYFTERQNELATIAKALGHPARIAIVEHLLKVDQCICGDIVNELPLSQPTVSQHLRELKSVGIIKGNVEGTSVCYCIDKEKWLGIRQLLVGLFDVLTEDKSSCC
jgi:DNA-binding transcriptional ArsR family regulator